MPQKSVICVGRHNAPDVEILMRLIALSVICLATASPAVAQVETPLRNIVQFSTPVTSTADDAAALRQAVGRGGFTVLVNLGLGFQRIQIAGESESTTGLAGANFGIGGFVNPNVAVLGRFSGTNVTYDDLDVGVIAGVVGATAQFWVHTRFAVEAGGGLGFFRDNADEQDNGFGLILGATAVLARGGKHNLTAGVEYAPAFFSDELFGESFTIHNFGFTIGYQFSAR
jgi:hypothetical protein